MAKRPTTGIFPTLEPADASLLYDNGAHIAQAQRKTSGAAKRWTTTRVGFREIRDPRSEILDPRFVEPLRGTMLELTQQIRVALKHGGLYSLALSGSLAAVDMCGALESEDGRSSGVGFRAWVDKHLQEEYSFLSSEDLWQLRCGYLHQGHTVGKRYKAIIFTLPNDRNIGLHNNIINDALNLDLVKFVSFVLDRIEAWWEAAMHAETVRRNAEKLARTRPEGLLPYIGGLPVFG